MRTWLASGAARRVMVAATIAALTLLAFQGARRGAFLLFDDSTFIATNPHLRDGLSGHGLRWALTADLSFDSAHADYWMPLTVASRLLDVELYGMDAAGHHFTNVLLHALNAMVLFLVLEAMTGAPWPSAWVAALFALHPLQVEPVAWATARKDVLSGMFWMLALASYVAWTRRGGRVLYVVTAALFAAGLLAKPIVAFPFVLLLVDAWPLRRLADAPADRRWKARLLEKAPLFALALLSALITFRAHQRGGYLPTLEALPLGARLSNAIGSLVAYLASAAWPFRLGPSYPLRPAPLLSAATLAGAALLATVTAIAVRMRARRPWLLTGWSWFLVVLVPVLGLVQTGPQSRADRFMYLPLIGLGVMVAWTGAEVVARNRRGLTPITVAAGAALAGCAILSARQVVHWRDTASLYRRAVAVSPSSAHAHNGLGAALAQRGSLADAERHYREAVRLDPGFLQSRFNLALLLEGTGRGAEAREQLAEAERRAPASADVQMQIGLYEAYLGRREEALARYEKAVAADPRSARARITLGNLLVSAGDTVQAAAHYAEAARLQPDNADAWNNLGLALTLLGRGGEAIGYLDEALRLDPGHIRARTNRGRALASRGLLDAAQAEYRDALRRAPHDADAHYELGRVLAAQGRLAEAGEHLREAVRLEPTLEPARAELQKVESAMGSPAAAGMEPAR